MRVLVASLSGPGGGIATYTRTLANGLAAAGQEVVLVAETGPGESLHPRIELEGLRAPRRLPEPLSPFEDWGRRSEVAELARAVSADVVHVTNLGLAPRHDRLVITAWDPVPGPAGRFRAAPGRGEGRVREAAYAVADAVAARRASAIVAVTPAVLEGVAGFGRPAELVPPFLEDDRIEPRARGGSGPVLFVAQAADQPRKGLGLAVEAVACLRERRPGVRLVVAGGWIDESRRDRLPEFCEPLGTLSGPEVRAALRGAGCLLIASRWEEFGYVGLEALAAGAPVACTPLPAFEGMSGGGVFTAADRSPAALAEAIGAALACEAPGFPDECRASVAIPRLIELYRRV